jgi:cbb3-type cytochrome oxidase maturation protein
VSGLLLLIPIALGMGLIGLIAFLWAARSGQFDDPDGAATRILVDEDRPLPPSENHDCEE